MVYLYDLIFTLAFFAMKRFFMYIHDSEYNIYMQIRKLVFYVEICFILVAMYFCPQHDSTEKAVSFFMCLITAKAISPLIFKSNKDEVYNENV